MEKKFTVKEFKNYLESKDSMGDIHFYLSEENIEQAQIPYINELAHCYGLHGKYWHSDKNKIVEIVDSVDAELGLLVLAEYEEITLSDAEIAYEQEFLFELKPHFQN